MDNILVAEKTAVYIAVDDETVPVPTAERPTNARRIQSGLGSGLVPDYAQAMAEEDSGVRFASVARQLLAEPDEEQTLDKAVAVAAEIIDGCDEAGVSIVHHGKQIETPAATSDTVRRGDELQYELNEGPCMDSLRKEQTTISPDLANESRWPAWGPRVVEELGIRSMLCFQLFTDSKSLGALNMYSRSVDAFDDDDQAVGLTLAAQIAVALEATRQVETYARGIASRTVIGQAQGMLMERYNLSGQRAFEVLKRISQDGNIKLIAVATEVVKNRRVV
jgi:GAF domain-containing protein